MFRKHPRDGGSLKRLVSTLFSSASLLHRTSYHCHRFTSHSRQNAPPGVPAAAAAGTGTWAGTGAIETRRGGWRLRKRLRASTRAGGQRRTVATQSRSRYLQHRVTTPRQDTASRHRVKTPRQVTTSSHRVKSPRQVTASKHRVKTPRQDTALTRQDTALTRGAGPGGTLCIRR